MAGSAAPSPRRLPHAVPVRSSLSESAIVPGARAIMKISPIILASARRPSPRPQNARLCGSRSTSAGPAAEPLRLAASRGSASHRFAGRKDHSIFAINLFAALVPFLGLERKRCDRPRVESLERDRFAGFLAESVGAVIDAAQRRVDLCNELALPVARSKLELTLGLGRSPIGKIRMRNSFGLEVLDGPATLAKDFFFPVIELAAEIFALALAHEGFAFRRPVAGRKFGTHAHSFDRESVSVYRRGRLIAARRAASNRVAYVLRLSLRGGHAEVDVLYPRTLCDRRATRRRISRGGAAR